MSVQSIQASESFHAPIDDVFDFFAKHENLGKVFAARVRRTEKASEGEDENGKGSVRKLRIGLGPAFYEKVTVFEAPHRIEYEIVSGVPIKHHLGVMEFSESDGVTTLDYTIELESKIPGTSFPIAQGLKLVLGLGLPRARRIIESSS